MTASEELKALDAATPLEKYEIDLFAFLPELIAVVEAAEKVTFYGQDAHRYNEWHGSSIVKALAALDAKLSVT